MNGTRNKYRLTLVELVLLSTGIAALLAWSLQDRTRELVWLQGALQYTSPTVPKNWKKDLPKRVAPGGNAVSTYSPNIIPDQSVGSGSELLTTAHRCGWNACRYHFYSEFELGRFQLVGKFEEVDLSSSEGIESAATLAYAHGYEQCHSEIDRLLLTHKPDELRSKLARKKAASLPILLIAILCFVALAIIRWRRYSRFKLLQPRPSS